jgi:hypothetical protein
VARRMKGRREEEEVGEEEGRLIGYNNLHIQRRNNILCLSIINQAFLKDTSQYYYHRQVSKMEMN